MYALCCCLHCTAMYALCHCLHCAAQAVARSLELTERMVVLAAAISIDYDYFSQVGRRCASVNALRRNASVDHQQRSTGTWDC